MGDLFPTKNCFLQLLYKTCGMDVNIFLFSKRDASQPLSIPDGMPGYYLKLSLSSVIFCLMFFLVCCPVRSVNLFFAEYNGIRTYIDFVLIFSEIIIRI